MLLEKQSQSFLTKYKQREFLFSPFPCTYHISHLYEVNNILWFKTPMGSLYKAETVPSTLIKYTKIKHKHSESFGFITSVYVNNPSNQQAYLYVYWGKLEKKFSLSGWQQYKNLVFL